VRGDHAQDYAGLWVDAHGRALDVVPSTATDAQVTIAPALTRACYSGRGRFASETRDLPATVKREDGETPRLIVETGMVDVGPTYQLTFAADDDGNAILIPHIGIGLYDEPGGDMGVPWAHPIASYRRAGEDEQRTWLTRRG